MWWHWLLGVLGALAALWLLLVAALWLAKPDHERLRESMRLLPDVVRLLTRLARDHAIPLRVRLWLWGLLAYLAMPIDLIPDFIPVLGYADDAIAVAFVLRFVAHRAGTTKLAEHWPGTAQGLDAVQRLARITDGSATAI